MLAFGGVALAALVAIGLWPFYNAWHMGATTPNAPVNRDYELRDRFVSFYERQVRRDARDQISARLLAQQYMQRFRERYDMDDVLRARRAAQRSIALQPRGNTSAELTLASTYLAYHDFSLALAAERRAESGDPGNPAPRAQVASVLLELGRYDEARATLSAIPERERATPAVEAVDARYDELNGRLDDARREIDACIRVADSDSEASAYDRSWFHLRAGQLAFAAGDTSAARAHYDAAIDLYPNNAQALAARARLYRGEREWQHALADATRSAQLYPLPQTLQYQADAQRALGDRSGASATEALIDAESRLYAAQGVNDRLLALYYADRRRNLGGALRAAQDDAVRRGDELYADDTLAWVFAMQGKWREAAPFAQRALRRHTQDAEMEYHAGIIAAHTGDVARAKSLLAAALAQNAAFDPFEADDARRVLATLGNGEAK